MKTRQRVPSNDSSKSSFTPIQAKSFQSRPFASESSAVLPTQSTPDIQTQLEQARHFGYDLSNISMSAPNPVTIQPKLTIGQPGDKYEQEADQVASQVVNQINTPAPQSSGQGQTVQREEMSKEEDKLDMKPEINSIQRDEVPKEDEKLDMKPEVNSIQRDEMPKDDEKLQPKSTQEHDKAGASATPDLESSIQQSRGNGQPLGDNIRTPMEKAFGADFSGVRVHADAQSDQLNQSIQARAFTTGQDVFFRQGAYNPGSSDGQELLAHELTHVVQQNGSAVQQKQQEQQ
jgi:hypothetical protein